MDPHSVGLLQRDAAAADREPTGVDVCQRRTATCELHEAIRQFNECAANQTREMVRLTKVLAWLTAVMLVAVITQVVLAVAEALG